MAVIIYTVPCGCKKHSTSSSDTISNSNTLPKIFEKVDVAHSRLYFENSIAEDVSTMENLFNYDYFYNGAGVGLEDLNNDGLLDVFFCGNQVPNKLFLNKGDFVFEDITKKAQINRNKNWSNGVTFVDINKDGWMDIYVSQGGAKNREDRKNLLFVNQKNETFVESASQYGLADTGISTQTVFFDFDRDGDLDCFVMNENELYGYDPINLNRLVSQNKENQYYNSSHLYRNENGTFVDVTLESGVQRPIFGLGVSVSDFNNDGWLDFYIASDYYIPDALFINNQDGTFKDEIKAYTNQVSYYGMGMDIADVNNDKLQDIFVLDMAANDHIRSKTLMASMNTQRFDYLINQADYHHQYMYNSLQLNTGVGKYSNIAQSTAMANTDWSWSVLMSDFDHDEDKDIYVTNGYRRYALDNDLQRKVYEAKVKYKNRVPIEIKKKLYAEMPSEKLPNILFENHGKLNFQEDAKKWGLADHSFSNGSAIGDLDNDGDLDIVVNNIDENCLLYQNMTNERGNGNFLKVKTKSDISESFPRITIDYKGKSQLIELRRVRGYRSAHEKAAHFGLGQMESIDSLTVIWPDGQIIKKFNVPANTTILVDKKNASSSNKSSDLDPKPIFTSMNTKKIGIEYLHQENSYDDFEDEILLPYRQSTLGPFISKGDFNGDALEDFFVGGASGQSGSIYLQKSSGLFVKKFNPAFESDKISEDMEAAVFDWDNDGDMDLFVVSGGNEFSDHSSYYADRLYLNDGKGQMTKYNSPILEKNTKSGKSVTSLDFDNDGDLDILVGNRIIPQNYPIPSGSTLFENRDGQLVDVTHDVAPELKEFGIVNSIISTDFDKDGQQDFIAVGEWSEIGIFKNEKGFFKRVKNVDDSMNPKGWWFSISETDINNDGLPDYVVGNVGSNIKFKTSVEKPLKIFVNDFDKNGTPDIVLSKKYKGEYVPIRGRECSSQQMPFIKQKFENYSDFAHANMDDIFGENLKASYTAEATEFKSMIMLNLGEGKFKYEYLPNQAQFFPILSTSFIDLNDDGFEDAIIAGNIYNTEVETPRLDAISGLILISDGKNNYTPMNWKSSGLLLDGNVKDLEIFERKSDVLILGAQNDGAVLTFLHHK